MLYMKFRLVMFVLLSLMMGCSNREEGGGRKKGQFSFSEGINPDIPILLDKMSEICADRWTIGFGENNTICLESNQKVLGVIAGYSYDGTEQEHSLDTSFKIVDKVTPGQVSRLVKNRDDLREQGKAIKQEQMKGHVRYKPEGSAEEALVLKIREVEGKVGDFPEFRYKSIYLSVPDTMSFFVPNKQNNIAVQYKKDIDSLYDLFEELYW
jgi:hypothetical protein